MVASSWLLLYYCYPNDCLPVAKCSPFIGALTNYKSFSASQAELRQIARKVPRETKWNHVNSINKRSFSSRPESLAIFSSRITLCTEAARLRKQHRNSSLVFMYFFFNFHLIVSPIPFRLRRVCAARNAKEFNVSERREKIRKKVEEKKKLNNLSSRDASTVHEYIVSFHLF